MGVRYVMTASADMPGPLNQLRRAELTANLSPRGLTLPLAVVARGANPMLGENFRPLAWEFRRPPSLAGRSLHAGESGDGFQRP